MFRRVPQGRGRPRDSRRATTRPSSMPRAVRPSVVSLLWVAVVWGPGCLPQPAGPDGALRQTVTVEPLLLVVPASTAGALSGDAEPVDDDAPAPAPEDGPVGTDGFAPVRRAVRVEAPGPRCPAWSTCEVHAVFASNRDLFRRCARIAGASVPEHALAFHLHATIGHEGTVTGVELSRVSPDARGLEACLGRAVRDLPFSLDASDMTTTLDVDVRIVAGAAAR